MKLLRTFLRWVAFPGLCVLLTACATKPAPPVAPAHLLADALFAPSAEVVDKASVFALSEPMRAYAQAHLRHPNSLSIGDPRVSLLDALYSRGQLKLRYDASRTRHAAEAFEARSGNCLSLVIMTAAFAKHMGLDVTFQHVLADETYSRTADLTLASGHVNLVLGRPLSRMQSLGGHDNLVVDFLPPEELRGQRTRPAQEQTIVAMYLNNRSAEALTQGRLADAYAWARASLLEDPQFSAAANTLAVIYLRAGHLPQAEVALRHVLGGEPENIAALSNLRVVLQRAGRSGEAEAVHARLQQLQPHPPFHFLELGRQAMDAGDFERARQFFARELRLQPYQHEVHFWAAQAWAGLGNRERAVEHLRHAMDYSLTAAGQDIYAGKLERLRALRVQ